MSNQPLVSIIIPTRNRKELLLQAVKSALVQSYKNIQLVVHDNNSTDGTQEYIRQNVTDKRLEFYRASEDLRMTDNWNRAFQHVRGDYFLRLDDDNILAPDFIETALLTVMKYDLDIFILSPLIVNLQNKVSTLFSNERNYFALNKFQVVYLEYFNLIDSNYVLYKLDTVLNIFPDKKIYQTTLPDRYMDYCMVSRKQDLRVGMSSEVKGITRFDYRAPLLSDYRLVYIDYDKLSTQDILKQKDCLSNFHMHRANTLAYFLNTEAIRELKIFFEKKIIHPALIRTLMKLGHIYMAREAYTWNEWVIYNRYAFQIMTRILSFPFARFEGRCLLINILAISRNVIIGNLKSFWNILFHQKRMVIKTDPRLGDKLAQEMISGIDIVDYSKFAEHGSLSRLLEKVNTLSI